MGRYFYRQRMQVDKKVKRGWDSVVVNARIYELTLPQSDQIQGITGEQEEWGEQRQQGSSYSYTRSSATIMRIAAIWKNPKNTIAAFICGKEHASVVSRENSVEGWTSIHVETDQEQPPDVFDNLQVGTWLVVYPRYTNDQEAMEIGFVSNESLEDVKKILQKLTEMAELRSEKSDFPWRNENIVSSFGTVTLQDILHQRVIFDRKLREFEWIKRKDFWDLRNQVKARMVIQKINGVTSIKVKGLDGSDYLLEAPENTEAARGYSRSVASEEWWHPFIYRKVNDQFLKKTQPEQQTELMQHFIEITRCLPKEDYKLGFNGKILQITHKIATNGAILTYLEGKVIKAENLADKSKNYFLFNTPIVEEEVDLTPADSGLPSVPKAKQMLSEEAKKMIADGLNGEMEDLEGEFPFHLNIVYKKKERGWYLEIAGKEFYVKGGQTALSKIITAIKGTARVDREKYGYAHGGRETLVIRDRIAELVGDENALWIVLQVKKMGALMKAMKGSNEEN